MRIFLMISTIVFSVNSFSASVCLLEKSSVNTLSLTCDSQKKSIPAKQISDVTGNLGSLIENGYRLITHAIDSEPNAKTKEVFTLIKD